MERKEGPSSTRVLLKETETGTRVLRKGCD